MAVPVRMLSNKANNVNRRAPCKYSDNIQCKLSQHKLIYWHNRPSMGVCCMSLPYMVFGQEVGTGSNNRDEQVLTDLLAAGYISHTHTDM